MKFAHLLVFAGTLATAFSFAGPKLSKQAQAVQAIKKLSLAWSKSSSKFNLETWMSYYSEDAVVLAPNEQVADTPAKIRKGLGQLAEMPGLQISWTVEKVSASSSGDLGYCWGKYKLSFKTAEGGTISDAGKTTEIWRKQKNGSWKCVLDTWNTSLPSGK